MEGPFGDPGDSLVFLGQGSGLSGGVFWDGGDQPSAEVLLQLQTVPVPQSGMAGDGGVARDATTPDE